MYLLESDMLTWFHAGHSGVVKRVRQVGEINVGTTVISEIEILRGRHTFLMTASTTEQLLRAQVLLQRSKELLARIFAYNERDSRESESG
jgi:hypothetical protein